MKKVRNCGGLELLVLQVLTKPSVAFLAAVRTFVITVTSNCRTRILRFPRGESRPVLECLIAQNLIRCVMAGAAARHGGCLDCGKGMKTKAKS